MLVEDVGASARAAVDARVGALVAEHRTDLVRLCTRKLAGDRHLAEDVVQDVFVKLQRALSAGTESRDPRAWLRTAVRTSAIDELRRRGPVVLETPPDATVEHAFAGGDPHLEVAWTGLSERHREILRMREIQGMPYEEIATAMATRVTTIDTLLFRARAALRREYHRAAATSATTPLAVGPLGRGWIGRVWQSAVEGFQAAEVRVGDVVSRLGVAPAALAARAAELLVAGGIAAGAVAAAPALPVRPPTLPPVTAPALPTTPSVPTVPPAPPVAPPSVPATPPTTTPAPPPLFDHPVEQLLGAVQDGLTKITQEIVDLTARNR